MVARRSKSVYAGKLDLFYNAELSWVDSSRSELGTLKEVLVLDYAEELRRSYRNTLVAGYFTQLVEYVMESGEVVEDIYGLLVRALGYLKKQDAELRGVVYFEQEIAKLLGVWDGARAPHLSLESAVGGLPQGRDRCVTLLS